VTLVLLGDIREVIDTARQAVEAAATTFGRHTAVTRLDEERAVLDRPGGRPVPGNEAIGTTTQYRKHTGNRLI
jgi:hypothetical protein